MPPQTRTTRAVIRPRREEDLPALVEALRAQQPTSRYPVRDPLPIPYEDFLHAHDAIAAWTAELDGRPVGHVCRTAPPIGSADAEAMNEAAARAHGCAVGELGWVSSLFVGLGARGTGLGRRLLHTAVREIRASGAYPTLEVLPVHAAAARMYLEDGWREVLRTRPDWLREAAGETGPDVAVLVLPAGAAAGDRVPGRQGQRGRGVRVGVVVAMDGPSGSGKSSTARGVAERLGLRYLDTGAMYRALTWWMLEHDVDTTDPEAVAAHVDDPRLQVGQDASEPSVHVDGTDVADAIRGPEVTAAVSAVSAVPQVRARLLGEQRAAIGTGGIVVEGRDIGTTVAPDADVKVFLTADPSARATRRAAEQFGSDVSATERDLARRDAIDAGRTASPLAMAEDAVHLDTTAYTLEQVVDQVVALVRERVASAAT